jgi:hypothetical protein
MQQPMPQACDSLEFAACLRSWTVSQRDLVIDLCPGVATVLSRTVGMSSVEPVAQPISSETKSR